MPKALICRAWGPPETLTIEDIPSPVAGPGQVVVSVRAAALNFPDTLIIQGKYQFKPSPPFSPGAEISGVIKQTGPGVGNLRAGDAVFAQMPSPYGGFAEEVLLDAGAIMPLVPGMDFVAAAAFGAAYGTSYHALRDRAALKTGETLLVLGAAGGIGLASIELGRRMGARVIAAASSEDKLATCRRYGAAETINYETEDLRAAIRRLTGDRGVDVVCDPVGGRFAEPALRGMARNGRYLVVGFTAGEIPRIPLNLALLKECAIVGVFWSGFLRNQPEEGRAEMLELSRWVAAGELKPLVSATYPLERGADALSDMLARKIQGKAVLLM